MSTLEFIDQFLEAESFSGRSVDEFLSVNSHFVDCKFEKVCIKDAAFGGGPKKSVYMNCSFNSSRFNHTVPGQVRFENCKFLDVRIKEFFCLNADFINCKFSGKISTGNFCGEYLDYGKYKKTNEIYGNDFSNLDMDDIGFLSVDLSKQKFPKSDDFTLVYDLERFLRDIRAKYLSSKDLELRQAVFKVVEILEIGNQGGNNQLFLDRRSFPKALSAGIDAVFAIA